MINLYPEFAEVDEPIVEICIPLGVAKTLSEGMSDLLCWARGFEAAIPEDTGRHPMGINGIRELRIRLNRAIDAVESTHHNCSAIGENHGCGRTD